MGDLKYWEDIMKKKMSEISFSDMVKWNASWKPLIFYKLDGHISRYPNKDRLKNFVSMEDFVKKRDSLSGVDFDFGMTFFDNFYALMQIVPWSYLMDFYGTENCHYSDCCFGGAKDSYLSVVVGDDSEKVFYSYQAVTNVVNVFNSVSVYHNCENIYFASFVTGSFNIFFARNIHNSSDIWMSHNLIGCHECVLCNGLENQSYCI